MYKYRSKCRWNMLLHIDGEEVEIRPGEFFESKTHVNSRYLEVINKPQVPKKKGRPPKVKTITPSETKFEEELNGNSTSG